ncbi:MAG: hypothetical protein ACFFDT_39960 [Candidatus Hodarchaeota archaeon]
METYISEDLSPTQFFLAHIIFDEEHGPVLKSYLAHELEIPRIILQGVTTTLFTMAIGVGEPTGEPDTAIIPINVTGIQGRVLIHSFTVDDPEARGRNRIESFMLFIPRAHQDKLLQHSLTFSNILQEAIRDIKIQNNGKNDIYSLEKVFGNIKKVLLTRIDNNIQNLISEICTDQETVVVSDGTTIRAVHNIVLSPDFISLINEIPSLLRDYGEELKAFGTFFDALPIEIHGKTGNQQLYLITIENNFILAFSSGKGRLGSLFRFFREILWDLNIQNASLSDTHISKYRTVITDKSHSFPQNQYLDISFELLKSYKPIVTDTSILRCSSELKTVEILRTTSSNIIKKHAFICQIFNLIDQLCIRLFRTSLIKIVLSQHGSNTIALLWGVNSEKNVSLFMVGDSPKGVGLLKLVSEQILEYRSGFNPIIGQSE